MILSLVYDVSSFASGDCWCAGVWSVWWLRKLCFGY